MSLGRIGPKEAATDNAKAMVLMAGIILVPQFAFVIILLWALLTFNITVSLLLDIVVPFPPIYFALIYGLYNHFKGKLADKLNFAPAIFNFPDGSITAYTYTNEPWSDLGGIVKEGGMYYAGKFYPDWRSPWGRYNVTWGEPVPMPNGQHFRKAMVFTPAEKSKCFKVESGRWTVSGGMPVPAAAVFGVFDCVDMSTDIEPGFEGEPVPTFILSACHYTYLLNLHQAKMVKPNMQDLIDIRESAGLVLAQKLKLELRDVRQMLESVGENEPHRKEQEAERFGAWVGAKEAIFRTKKSFTPKRWQMAAIIVTVIGVVIVSLVLSGIL